jgi:PAS domain-containing protein
MPGMSGVEFLTRVRQQFPDIIRVVFSGYTDIETITASINEGNVYKFIHKPWEDAELKEIIREALKVHKLQIENERLSKEIKIKNEELLRFNKDLELEVQRRTEKIIKQSRELEMSRDILESLPVAVICLNQDKTVMYTNSLASILFARFDDGLVGSNLEGKFDQDLIDIVNATVDTTLPQRSIVSIEDNYYYGLKCVPICSGEEVNMIILSFSELD